MSDHVIDYRDLNLAGDSNAIVMESTDEFHSLLRTSSIGLKSESTNARFSQSTSSIIARDEGGGGDNLNTMNIVSLVTVQQQRSSPNARTPIVAAAESPTLPRGSPNHPGQGAAKTFMPPPLNSSSRYSRRQRCASSLAEATNSLVQCSSFIGGASSPNQQSSAFSSVPTTYFNPQNFTMEYLSELLKDKKQLASLPNMFVHLERLVEEEALRVSGDQISIFTEVCKVRAVLFGNSTIKDNLPLPDPVGDVISLQEKVYVPIKEYPDYNFVGRILGPRGMTAKQLEQETGCKIMVRGRGSMRDKNREEANRNKPNWEHLNDDLHVLVQCEDAENRAKVKLQHAIDEIKRLLVPAAEGEDELKRKQLMELAIINGTYRPANQSKIALQTPRLLTPMTFTTALRSPMVAAPIMFHSPGRFAPPMVSPQSIGQQNSIQTSLTASIAAAPFFQSPANGELSQAGLFYNCLDLFPTFGTNHYAAGHAFLNSPIPFGAQPAFLGSNDHPFLTHHPYPHHQPCVVPPPAAPLVSSRH